MKQIINYLNTALKKQKTLVIFIILVFFMGLVIGSLFINFIGDSDKTTLTNQVVNFFLSIKKLSADVFGIKVFSSSIINNILQLLIIFILGISMIGILVVILIMFFKGFTLGVTISSIILKYQLKGIIGALLYLFPCFIINILIYIFFSIFAVNASIRFFKALIKKDNLNFKKFFGKYLLSFMVSIFLMSLCCFLEAFLTPILLKLFTFLI